MHGLLARVDPKLRASVVSRTPLLYAAGADASLDRPAHVRAGSSLAWLGDRLAVVQDDALFLALVDPRTARVESIALPAPDGVRLFDERRGNKRFKADLEACISVDDRLIAFGSGSTAARERILVVRGARADFIDGSAFYSLLRDPAFAGSELNLEGALVHGGDLVLLQRGNGAARDGLEPKDAVARVDLARFLSWLDGRSQPPTLRDVVEHDHDLGSVNGVRLTFTDGASRGGDIIIIAVAEDSPDAVRDGPVAGACLGVLDRDGARLTPILERGAPFLEKPEGIALDATGAWLVLDRDDPDVPSELCRVELSGFGLSS